MIQYSHRYKIEVEYNGSRFVGWQRQDGLDTIQGKIEWAILQLTQKEITIHSAGRTDGGVHALAMVAHFDLEKYYPAETITRALNHFLQPWPITILNTEIVSENFHSRFSALERHYAYKIINRSTQLALMEGFALYVFKRLDIDSMRKASTYLIGKHDFTSFRSAHCQAKSSIRNINSIEIINENDLIIIKIKAKSFLHNQVRIIVGSLLKVGKGEWAIDKIPEILLLKDRTKSGPTAPAHGLYFEKVVY